MASRAIASLRGLVASAIFLTASAAPAFAAVYVVGPASIGADFQSLQGAVNAASDGDVLLIDASLAQTGTTIQNKSLTLVGLHGVPLLNALTVRDLSPNRRVALSGLRIRYLPGLPQGSNVPALSIKNCAGAVLVDACHIGAANPNVFEVPHASALMVEQSSAVVVVASQLYSNQVGAGVDAFQSTVRLHGSIAVGGRGNTTGLGPETLTPGGVGVHVFASTIHAFGCSFTGGKGGEYYDGADNWYYNTAGGSGAKMVLSSTLVAQDCTFTPGQMGSGWDFPPDPPPIDFGLSGLYSEIPGPIAQFEISRVLAEGSTLQLDLEYSPNAAALLWAGSLHAPLVVPGMIGALGVALPATVVSIGAIPPSGHLQAFVNLPFLPPGLDAATLTVQASLFPTGQPPAWSNPAQMTVLDSAL